MFPGGFRPCVSLLTQKRVCSPAPRGRTHENPFLLFATLFTSILAAQAQTARDATVAKSSIPPHSPEINDHYRAVEVDPFDLKRGLEFPPEYPPLLQQAVAKRIVSAPRL